MLRAVIGGVGDWAKRTSDAFGLGDDVKVKKVSVAGCADLILDQCALAHF